MNDPKIVNSAELQLRQGCYLLRFLPTAEMRVGTSSLYENSADNFGHFDGTMRITQENGEIKASGDLYYHIPFTPNDEDLDSEFWDWPLFEPTTERIQIFPFDKYRFYVHVAAFKPHETHTDTFNIRFELHEFLHDLRRFDNRGCFFSRLRRSLAPRGYHSRLDYLAGEVTDWNNNVVGMITMGWVSDYLRRAVVEIDRVPASEAPLNNGCEVTWQSIFGQVGWQVTVEESDNVVSEPSGESWSGAELHDAMLSWRDPSSLEHEWRYHLLCVRRLDRTERGFMFDRKSLDSDKIPREGAAVSSHWVFPNVVKWGKVQGVRFGNAAAPYFRTAIHEIGHALSLHHNKVGFHVMRTTGKIAEGAAMVGKEFPDNIEWSFAPEDAYRLRHAPDPFVQPGALDFGELLATFMEVENPRARRANHLNIEVTAISDTVPLGAPIRVHVALVNHCEKNRLVPASLSFRDGHVSGNVYDDSGNCRKFCSLFLCIDERELIELSPGERLEHSFTLLRGSQGSLFPYAGIFRIEFKVLWKEGSVDYFAKGECQVEVMKSQNTSHEVVARTILETPDTALSLILAGDHLPDGRAAIQMALENEVLRPHYALIEARRLASRFRDRPADLNSVLTILDESVLITPSEICRMILLVNETPTEQWAVKEKILELLKKCASKLVIGQALLSSMDEL